MDKIARPGGTGCNPSTLVEAVAKQIQAPPGKFVTWYTFLSYQSIN